MKRLLCKYFWSVEGLLFWLGGFVTIIWSTIMYSVAHGLTPQGREPGMSETMCYVGALMFLLGVKGARRRLNKEKKNGDVNGDLYGQYPGELWATVMIMNAFLIWFEFYTPFQICTRLGPVVKNPTQLAYSTLGVAALFGTVKVLEVGSLIQKAISKIKIG